MSYELHNFTARNDWLHARRSYLTASDVGPVLGRSSMRSAHAVYIDKIDPAPPEPMDSYQEWGLRLEQPIAEKFQETTGYVLSNPGDYCIAQSKHWPWLAATFDRLAIVDGKYEPVEIKTVNAFDASVWRKAETIPETYRCQIHAQMLVAGVRRGWFAVLAGGNTFAHYSVELDRELAKTIVAKCGAWWESHVVAKVAPTVDGSQSTTDALQWHHREPETGEVWLPAEFDKAGDKWDRITKRLAQLEGAKSLLANQIRDALGKAGTVAVLPDLSGWTWKPDCNGKRTLKRKAKLKLEENHE
jgi:putative phage-type endonuclease